MSAQTVHLLTMILPPVVTVAGLMLVVSHDTYISRRHRNTLMVVYALTYALILQNALECYLSVQMTNIPLRTFVSIAGYAMRPAILALFCRILAPACQMRTVWMLVGSNGLLHLTALFSPVVFSFSANNHYLGGPLKHACLCVSLVLLLYLFFLSCRVYPKAGQGIRLIPALTVVLILGSVWMDFSVGVTSQPITFLTLAITVSCVFCYLWLHMQFVYNHVQDLIAGQQMQLMLSQIKPHFLYNALGSIEALCERDPKAAKQAMHKFSKYLRGNMDSLSSENLIPFDKELQHTQLYLELEQVRFGDALQVEYNIAAQGFFLPPLTLEPIVENAVKHGVRMNADGRGTVSIATAEDENGWELRVEDDGPGFNEQTISTDEQHIGIRNVRERLNRICDGSLTVQPAPLRGTVATIRIPKRMED